ncbi:MAG: amidase, partial [Patulibacter sp.]
MTDAALHALSATEALAGFRARTLSPVELMQATIARAEQVEPTVNALCHRFFDEALVAARASERRYARGGDEIGPLDGLPLVVKEEEPIAGQPWTQGSAVYRSLVASRSSVLAERVIASGAIVHARSTASELSAAAFTHSRLWGVTRNPWNPEWSPGGSSGGSAAALASGTTTLATGSDTAGSIRLPAAFSGVVGFKPPYGRVPADPPFNLDCYVHYGPLARTVADCRLLQNVLAGPHPSDPVALDPKVELPEVPGSVVGRRIAVSTD